MKALLHTLLATSAPFLAMVAPLNQAMFMDWGHVSVTKTVLIDTGTTWTTPSDFASLVSIEAIGAGGAGSYNTTSYYREGGGGGAYSITSIGTFAASTSYNIHIGVAGGTQGTSSSPGTADTWFNNAASTLFAQGGKTAAYSSLTYGGGAAASCYPTTGAFNGGTGYGGLTPGYGGGAAGKHGAGANATSGGSGQGDNGFGGTAGGAGTEWSYAQKNSTVGAGTAGSGGGGSAAGGLYGGAGGCAAASGGAGANGCIFFTYRT